MRRVIDGRRLLLDPGRGDQAVHAAVLRGDLLHDGVELRDVAHVDASVGEGGAEFGLGAFLDPREIGGGRLETVEGVDWLSWWWC